LGKAKGISIMLFIYLFIYFLTKTSVSSMPFSAAIKNKGHFWMDGFFVNVSSST
jgi:hypothetical protein